MIKIQICFSELMLKNNNHVLNFILTKKDIKRFSKNDKTSWKTITRSNKKLSFHGSVKNNMVEMIIFKKNKKCIFLFDLKKIPYNKIILSKELHPLHGKESGVMIESASFMILQK